MLSQPQNHSPRQPQVHIFQCLLAVDGRKIRDLLQLRRISFPHRSGIGKAARPDPHRRSHALPLHQLSELGPILRKRVVPLLRCDIVVDPVSQRCIIYNTSFPLAVVVQDLRQAGHLFRPQEQPVHDRYVLIGPSLRELEADKQRPVKNPVPQQIFHPSIFEQLPQRLFGVQNPQFLPAADLPAPPVLLPVAADRNLSACFQRPLKQRFKQCGLCPVVAVHPADPLACGGIQPRIAGRGHAAVWLMDDLDPFVPLRIFIADFSAPIGGTVIYQNDFQIVIGLRQNALYTLAEILLHPVNRNDH